MDNLNFLIPNFSHYTPKIVDFDKKQDGKEKPLGVKSQGAYVLFNSPDNFA